MGLSATSIWSRQPLAYEDEMETIPSSQSKAGSHRQAHQHSSVSSHLGMHHKHRPPWSSQCVYMVDASHTATTKQMPQNRRKTVPTTTKQLDSLTNPSPRLPHQSRCPPAYANRLYRHGPGSGDCIPPPSSSPLPLFLSDCLVVCTGRREFVEKRRHISIPAF